MVFVPRIVNGTRSTFARGTVAKSDVSGFLRRHHRFRRKHLVNKEPYGGTFPYAENWEFALNLSSHSVGVWPANLPQYDKVRIARHHSRLVRLSDNCRTRTWDAR